MVSSAADGQPLEQMIILHVIHGASYLMAGHLLMAVIEYCIALCGANGALQRILGHDVFVLFDGSSFADGGHRVLHGTLLRGANGALVERILGHDVLMCG